MNCSRFGHVIMSCQKIDNRIEGVWIKPTDVETCEVIYSERKIVVERGNKSKLQQKYKPVYDTKKII